MKNNIGRNSASNDTTFRKIQAVAFATPSIGLIFFMGPMSVIQGIYAKHYGIALTSLAGIILISRIFDAVTDPLIGYLSDNYRARTGTRKSFVLVGGLCLIPCSYFLFVPPDDVTITYVAFWLLAFYLAATVKNISTLAWASEVTSDAKERTMLFSVLAMVGQVGGVLFFMVPFLPIFATTEITPDTLKVSVIIGASIFLPGLYIALKFVPDGPANMIKRASPKKSFKEILTSLYEMTKNNKPFLIFVAAYMFSMLGSGMFGGLFFIFVDVFLGQGEVFAKVAVFGTVSGMLVIPVAYKLVLVLGKKRTWMLSTLIMLSGIFYAGLLSPEESGFTDLLVLNVILFSSITCVGVITPALISETIEYGLLRDETERRGSYFSVYSLLGKAQAAIGMAMGFAIVGWLGFDATAISHNESDAFAIRMAVSWVPLTFSSLGLIFIWLTPLDDRRTAIICRRLKARNQKGKGGVDQPLAKRKKTRKITKVSLEFNS